MATTWSPSASADVARPGRISPSSATATCAPVRWRRPRCWPATTGWRRRSSTCARCAWTPPPCGVGGAGTGKALVVREANRFGGFGAEIAAWIAPGVLRAPRWTGDPPGRAGGAWCPVPPRPGGLVHARFRQDRRRGAHAGRVTEPMPSATQLLATQMDEAYRFVHDRVQGLGDEEFFWEPVTDCWTVRPGADGRWHADYAEPDPIPPVHHHRLARWCTSPSAR